MIIFLTKKNRKKESHCTRKAERDVKVFDKKFYTFKNQTITSKNFYQNP